MKRIIKTLLVIMALALVLLAFAGCEQQACQHTGGKATCTEKAICELCGEAYGPAPAHKTGFVPGLDATCTEGGYTSSSYCIECGEVFVPVTDIAATGHKMADVEGLEATCSKPGYTAYKECEVCGEIEGKEEIPALEHTMKDVAGLDATCTEDGYTAYKVCEVCDAVEGKEVIKAGHIASAEANCTTAQTCTLCGEELAPKLGHLDENLDVDCDREGCTGKVAPTADTVLSTFTANNLGAKLSTSGSYYVIGTITKVIDQRNGVFLIDDGSGEFYFRLPKNEDGVAHASWEIKLTLGDKVKLYGKINKFTTQDAPGGYYPAMQSPIAVVLEQHTHVGSEPTCVAESICACGYVVGPALGHIDADADNLCDRCSWNMKLVGDKIAIGTDAKYNGVVTNGEDGKALYWTWSGNEIDVVIHKGTSTFTVYTTAKDYMQLKKLNTLTVVNNGSTFKAITIKVTNANQLGYLKDAIGTAYTYTVDEVLFTVTIELDTNEDFVLANNGSNTVYVSGVEVYYILHEHTYVDGFCSCGAEAPKLYTAVMDNTITDTQTTYMTGNNDAELVGLDPTIFSVIGSEGSYGNNVSLYYKSSLAAPSQIRLFNHSSANGNAIAVSVAEGYEIVSIKITFAIVGRANGYVITDADGKEIANVATDATIENVEVVYDVNSGSFTFKNVHTGSSKQIWIDSIEITYIEK